MRAALPMLAVATKELLSTLRLHSERDYPPACRVNEISYLGDEGGIACHLDFGFGDSKQAHIVSITHLRFDRRDPLAREIEAYCKHRIKRLKQFRGGMAPS